MKRNLIHATAFFLICLCAVFCLKSIDTQAATKKMSTESNGKYTYYSVQGTIYRMDTNTGKTKKIKTIANTNWISDISYYKGYLYFTADYYYYSQGTDGSEAYICRIKTNGKGFKKLGCGRSARIYNGKIYYLRGTIKMYGVCPSTHIKEIARMNLSGGSKKNLLTEKSAYSSFEIVKDRIYYVSAGCLYRATISGKSSTVLVSSGVNQLLSDGTNIYYTTTRELHRIEGSSGTDNKLMNLAYRRTSSSIFCCTNILEVKNGIIYFVDNNNGYKLRKYNLSANKITDLKKFSSNVSALVVGKGKYAVIRRGITDSKYTEAVGRIKTTGKSYKTLKKYFKP